MNKDISDLDQLAHKMLYPTYSDKLDENDLQTQKAASYTLPLEHHEGTRSAHPIGGGTILEKQQ
jgi:hypothetical protein